MAKEKSNEFLAQQLDSDDTSQRQNARRLLVDRADQALPVLIKALKNKKHWTRWEAAKALAQIADSSAADALLAALRDREYDVRWLAAEGLISIGTASLIPLLQELIDKPDSSLLKEGAHHILHDMDLGEFKEIMEPVKASLEGASQLEPAVIAEQVLKQMKNV